MTAPKKNVYIVTDGEYSGYRIEAVFDDKAMADRMARIYDCRVETWTLNQLVDPITNGLRLFSVWLNPNGSLNGEARELTYFDAPHASHRKDGSQWTGWAKDADHAVKIAQDGRAKRRAKKAGIA